MQSEHGIAGQRVRPLPVPISACSALSGTGRSSAGRVIRPDERFAQFCADAHEQAQHTPLEFRTLESYCTLIAEIGEQFQLFFRSGYTFSRWRGDA
jgi:hypothetical protein